MKNYIILFTLLLSAISLAQVGVGTNTPSTTLEVVGKPIDNSVRDGITFPKLTCNQITIKHSTTPYTLPQTGTLLFITDTSALCPVSPPTSFVAADGVGFYLFDGIEFNKVNVSTAGVAPTGWGTLGNTSTLPSTNFIGTSDNAGLSIRTNNSEKIRITTDGKIGVGNSTPSVSLDVFGYPNLASHKSGFVPSNISCLQLLSKNSTDPYVLSDAGTILYINDISICSAFPPTSLVTNTGLYQFDGTEFQQITYASDIPPSTNNIGDIKTGMQTDDHIGWVLMDGRSCGSTDFSTSQQIACLSIGLPFNFIPDATTENGASQNSATYLANIDGNPSTVGTIGGNLDNIWAASDLPNLNHSHTVDPPNTNTTTNGNHNHQYQFESSTTGVEDGSGEIVRDNATQGFTTSTNGNHSHSVNIAAFNSANRNPGGSSALVPTTPRTLDVNMFLYLGQS